MLVPLETQNTFGTNGPGTNGTSEQETVQRDSHQQRISLDGTSSRPTIAPTNSAQSAHDNGIDSMLPGFFSRPTRALKDLSVVIEAHEHKKPQHVRSEHWAHVARSKYFQLASALLVAANAILIGVETDVDFEEEGLKGFQEWAEYLFCIIFLLEQVVKILAYGVVHYFRGHEWAWNTFDFSLVALNVFETASSFWLTGLDLSEMTVLRILRLMRLARMMRFFRLFKQLWLFVSGIVSALTAIFWGMLLTALNTYVCAVFITRILKDMTSDNADMYEFWGTLPRSMFSLFQVTTGDSWASVLARPVIEEKPELTAFFVLFVCVQSWALLNMVVAVVIESTLKNAMQNDEEHYETIRAEMRENLARVYSIFTKLDKDGDKMLTKEELLNNLHNEQVQSLLHAADISLTDVESFFDIVDTNGTGVLSIEEFISGALRCRGNARSKDLLSLAMEVDKVKSKVVAVEPRLRSMEKRQSSMLQSIDDRMARLEQALLSKKSPCDAASSSGIELVRPDNVSVAVDAVIDI